MTATLATLRAEAESLARQLPGVSLGARASSAIHAGSAGRKRAGSGEHFWQYRHHTPDDGQNRIDWRRSAKTDDLFVRETELETARTLYLWADPHPGFDWKSDEATITKADRARVLLLAVAAKLSRDGERVGVIGGQPPGFGGKAIERAGEDLLRTKRKDVLSLPQSTADPLAVPKSSGIALIASDFYDPKDEWQARLKPLASRCAHGLLLAVADPREISFSYRGRVEFHRPGSERKRLLERAENLREDYAERYAKHRRELNDLGKRLGWQVIWHETSESPLKPASELLAAMEAMGQERRL